MPRTRKRRAEAATASGAQDADMAAGRIRDIDSRLLDEYGDRAWSPRFVGLLDGLVHTILTQNTSDVNSHRAFDELKSRFPAWEGVAAAPSEAVEEAIRRGGISRVKAERIQAVLRRVREDCGSYSLRCLEGMAPERARDYLLELPGVGRKTAAVLLLFQLGYPFFPVDTHVFRVGRRLGLIPERANPERAHDIMDAEVPDDMKFRLHMNLVEHGRAVCKARKPFCSVCCLKEICPRIGVVEEG